MVVVVVVVVVVEVVVLSLVVVVVVVVVAIMLRVASFALPTLPLPPCKHHHPLTILASPGLNPSL